MEAESSLQPGSLKRGALGSVRGPAVKVGAEWRVTEEETMACSGLCVGDECTHLYIHGPGT